MKHLVFFLRLYLFWWLIFAVGRLVFMLLNYSDLFPEEFSFSPFRSFGAGLLLDLSASTYFLIVPFLCWLLSLIAFRHWQSKIILIWHYLFVPLVFIVLVANARLYREWKFPITTKAFDYLVHPEGWTNSLESEELLILIGLLVFLSALFLFRFKREKLGLLPLPAYGIGKVVSALVIAAAMFIALRGGTGLSPVNEATAWYSDRPVENHLALNPVWGLGSGFAEKIEEGNPYAHFPANEAEERLSGLLITSDSVLVKVNSKPNVVILLLESFSYDLVEKHEGKYASELIGLKDSSIWFENFYSSGFRTDQGLAAVFSGYPAVPDNSILRYPSKISTLPGLPRVFDEAGYQTGFWYGGDVDFANMRLLLNHAGFKSIMDGSDEVFRGLKHSRWGIPDKPFLKEFLRGIGRMKEPFFASALTLSLHSPFDIPEKGPLKNSEDQAGFLNSAWYADQALGDFFRSAGEQPWFKNTVFVVLADHGNPTPGKREYFDPGSRKIPMLITGNLVDSARLISKFGNHHDVPSTLLALLGFRKQSFTWSRNLLDPETGSFAYFAFEPGLGWITDEGGYSFHHTSGRILWQEGEVTDSVIKDSRAFQQVLYQDFLGR